MAQNYDTILYQVIFLDDLFGLRTMTFNYEESANDFCNQLLIENCTFIHFYKIHTCTIFIKDESSRNVP